MATKASATPKAVDPYYAALVAAWNNPTQPPPGVTGAPLTASMVTEDKILVVNAWKVSGAIPASFTTTGAEMLNCIDWGEFALLDPAEQANVLGMLAVQGQLLGGMDAAKLITGGMFVAYFPLDGPTIAALTRLAEKTLQIWWGVAVVDGGAGLSAPVSIGDCELLGLV